MIRLLYVEDNDDNVYMLKMRLELMEEFEVLVAEDGEKGCEAAARELPDLILMDLEMPVVDGWEASRRLKSNPNTRQIPIIGLSAHALAGEREKALAAGCEEFILIYVLEPAFGAPEVVLRPARSERGVAALPVSPRQAS